MNTLEEKLWNYIDGNVSQEEKEKISHKIENDAAYRALYQELLEVNRLLHGQDLDEPSMSFNRNVMEQVNQELIPVALKTKIDKRIVSVIGSLFAVSILGILIYAISLSAGSFEMPDFNVDFGKFVNPSSLMIFVLVDVALALVYFDSYIRKRNNAVTKR